MPMLSKRLGNTGPDLTEPRAATRLWLPLGVTDILAFSSPLLGKRRDNSCNIGLVEVASLRNQIRFLRIEPTILKRENPGTETPAIVRGQPTCPRELRLEAVHDGNRQSGAVARH